MIAGPGQKSWAPHFVDAATPWQFDQSTVHDHHLTISTVIRPSYIVPKTVLGLWGDMGHLLWFAGFLYSKNVKHEIKFLWPVSVLTYWLQRERQPVSLLMLCWSGLKAHLRECFSCSNFSNLISISSLLFCTNHISMECEAGSSTLLYFISRSSGSQKMIDIELQISISERSSGWAIN